MHLNEFSIQGREKNAGGTRELPFNVHIYFNENFYRIRFI